MTKGSGFSAYKFYGLHSGLPWKSSKYGPYLNYRLVPSSLTTILPSQVPRIGPQMVFRILPQISCLSSDLVSTQDAWTGHLVELRRHDLATSELGLGRLDFPSICNAENWGT